MPGLGSTKQPGSVRSQPVELVEDAGRSLERAKPFIDERGRIRRGELPPGGETALRRKPPSGVPRLKWGRIAVAGGLLVAATNPFGAFPVPPAWNPFIGPLAPLLPSGAFGDFGLICYQSPCTPFSGPWYVKAGNTCVPRTPQCPFGGTLVDGTYWSDYVTAVNAEFGGDFAGFPFANIIYFKTDFSAGYFVHEVVEVLPDLNVGIRPGPLPAIDVAIGYHKPNPNLVPVQWPDLSGPTPDLQQRLSEDQKAEERMARRRRITVITRNAVTRPPPRFTPPRRPDPRKTKETKIKFGSIAAYRYVMAAIDFITESQDAINAVYEALPCAIRVGSWKSGPQGGRYFKPGAGKCSKFNTTCRLTQLQKHWDRVDWDTAALNLVANQLQDAYIGMTDRLLEDSLRARSSWNNYAKFKGLQRELRDIQDRVNAERRARGIGQKECG